MRAFFNGRWQRIAVYVVLASMLAIGCRAIHTVQELRASSSPDVSRVMLKGGKVVEFNRDFGWYNKKAGTIEGVTVDTQHVEYHLSEISKVETVREYSLIPAAVVGVILIGALIYVVSALLTHAEFLR